MSLHAVSLFSGIGLLDLGLKRAGIPTRLLCEADASARSVLARRFPGVPIHPDVQELVPDDLYAAGADPARTVLAAGFPCQDISVAGNRAGMGEGTRSGLYWHIVRLLAGFPAKWIVLENVPGLLSSHGGRDMGAVLGSLGKLGYGYAWRVLDAQNFGVPQRRHRVGIVGHLGAPWGAPAEVLLEPDCGGRDSATLTGTRTRAARGASSGLGDRRIAATLPAHHGRMTAEDAANLICYQKVVRSGAHASGGNLPPEVWAERDVAATLSPFDLGSESRAVELVVARSIAVRGRKGGSACEVGPENGPVSVTGDRTHALTAEGHDASEDGTGRGTPIVAVPAIAATLTSAFHLTQDPVSGPVVPALGGKSGENGVATETVVRRLTPLECERLQGAPDGWTEGQADSPRYRQLGNAVAVPVFEWVGRRLSEVDAALTACRYTQYPEVTS